MREAILGYLLIINIFTFLLYGADKYKARRGEWRIKESVLLGLAAAGGSPAAWIAMYFFHHKTKKPKFFIGVPVLFAVHVLIWFFALGRLN